MSSSDAKDGRAPGGWPESGAEGEDDLWPPWSPAAVHRRARRGPPARDAGMRGPRASAPGREPGTAPSREPAGTPGREARETPRGRGRARQGSSLSRAEIVDAAIAVADADGPDAVSMRRIAQVLRAGTMSLYWHVASKEHLIDLMLEALVAEIDVPAPSGDWQADLRACALSHRASLLRHEWVIDYIGWRPALGPNTLRTTERTLTLLAGLGLDAATELTVVQSVNTYVLGAVLREFQELRVQREQERLLAALSRTGAVLDADVAAWRARLESAGEFPRFLRILTENVDPDAEETRDQRFEFGLDCLLRGIAVTAGAGSRPATAMPARGAAGT